MPSINMLSSAEKVKGQGVLAAYIEQVNLVKNGLQDNFKVSVNNFKICDIMHYHTIDFKFFLSLPFVKLVGTSVAYVHFVPDTIDNSLKLPHIIKELVYKYIIWFYKSMDYLVVVNPCFIDVLKKYEIEEKKITYIPNFVSEENFYKYEEESVKKIKQKFNIPLKKFVVLGVGQVQHRKGILDFIRVAEKLPQIQFIWAGGFSFGKITDGYKELKKIMKAPPKNVMFLGIVEREKMNDIYNIADVMFLPSYNELFPMSILEAMALKIPILLRDLDIYHNILFDFYLKGKDVMEFTQCIENIENNEKSYKLWCKKSWQCHQFYSKEHVLSMWKQFYDKIYHEKNKRKFRRSLNEK
ncbi:glycosyltransferase family 4 protein [Clostridium thailandense]|uniref:glycosyltransferase family 4 protein n=1 Tax=Clostridium thailandense TaxID=2794346 RepID=UPI003989EE44